MKKNIELETNTVISQEKLKVKEKLSYGLVVMASNPLLTLISGYLMIFYTNVIGLNPIAIGTLFLISRIMDGFSDPIMGFFVDHRPNKKMGKYRYLMILGTIICCLNFLLLWFGPALIPVGKLIVAYFSYLLLGFTYDIMDIPKNSFLPVMTANDKERISLGKYNALFTVVSGLVVGVVAPLILDAGELSMKAFAVVVLITAGFSLFSGIVGSLGIKERVTPVSENEKHSVKEYLSIFAQKPIIASMAFALIFSTGFFLTAAVNTYFFTYVIGDLALAGTVAILQLVGLVPGILMSGIFIRKLGKKGTFVVAPIVMTVFTLIRLIDPTSIPLIIISTIAGGFVLGAYQPAASIIGADNIDYLEYKTNYRSEAAVSSINTFIAKVGNGLAGAIPGYVLGFTGFISTSAQQPSSVINGLIMMVAVVPVFFYIISSVVFACLYKIDKETVQTVQTTLRERHAIKAAGQTESEASYSK